MEAESIGVVAHIDDLQSELDALKRHQAQTAAELDALFRQERVTA